MMTCAKPLLLAAAMMMMSRAVLAQPKQDYVLTFHGGHDRRGNFTVPGLTWPMAAACADSTSW